MAYSSCLSIDIFFFFSVIIRKRNKSFRVQGLLTPFLDYQTAAAGRYIHAANRRERTAPNNKRFLYTISSCRSVHAFYRYALD